MGVSVVLLWVEQSSNPSEIYYRLKKEIENKKCVFLSYYAANSGNSLPTFRDNLSVPPSRVKSPKRRNHAKAQ